jgi:hypothetical protein
MKTSLGKHAFHWGFNMDSASDSGDSKSNRLVWTSDMDSKLSSWLASTYGTTTPVADSVSWREASKLFPGTKASQVRKRYLGVVCAVKHERLSEDEAKQLIDCIQKMGFVWEDMATMFEGRTGLQLKNYYYTAQRRFIRRKQNNKQSKSLCPTIDAYFESIGIDGV